MATPENSDVPVVEIAKVRPYARLLTMLGEQLIKNDRIALVELIKNSYDADASRVCVDFVGFSASLENQPDSYIIISDNGSGMSDSVVRDHWLNPATPTKHDFKRHRGKSPGGRVMQGEKGIGRFAMFKLGSRTELVTRAETSPFETAVDFNLSFLDDDPRTSSSELPSTTSESTGSEAENHAFLDELRLEITRRPPEVFNGENGSRPGSTHGVRLAISGLRSHWTRNAVQAAYSDVARLQPLIPKVVADPEIGVQEVEESADFEILFLKDGVDLKLRDVQDSGLRDLFEDRAVLRVSGHFSDSDKSFLLNINNHLSVVNLDDSIIKGLWAYRRYFDSSSQPHSVDDITCGPFDFSLYVFDLTSRAPAEYRLDPEQKRTVREHRIYLYRDGVRVLPYGDVEDDWLQLDVIRGTQGADRVLSNDQTVGFVHITQERNPLLQDKTNREGLLESGGALGDFVALLQIAISYIRREDFARYVAREEQKRDALARREREVAVGFKEIRGDDRLPKDLSRAVAQLERKYASEKEYMDVRVERTEDLAGVGLSVEAASHDIISTANQALRLARSLSEYVKVWFPEDERLVRDANGVVEGLSFVASRLEDVQGLFVSTSKGKRSLEPAEFVSKVYRIFSSAMRETQIELNLQKDKQPLKVRTTDAALLQVLVNLFDNSIYWLNVGRTNEPLIRVRIDASNRQIVFADNGPGIRDADEPFIFEPFFSGRDQDGRGLGLYIAKQVSIRSGFEISLITDEQHKIAPGANFLLRFEKAES